MFLRSGKDAAARLQGIIQEKYQIHRHSVDLTVKSIARFEPVGKVDFGGGEYQAAGQILLRSARLRPEDRYEWWDLERGCYSIAYNETLDLAEDEIALLEPEPRLLRAGGTHTLTFFRGHVEPMECLLIVGVARLQVKQNARVSALRLFSLGSLGAATTKVTATPRKSLPGPKATPASTSKASTRRKTAKNTRKRK